VRFRNIEIKVVSLEDLLKMKKKAGRLRDLDDIEKLKRLHDER
jgi:predicted nucleotidyltransferase